MGMRTFLLFEDVIPAHARPVYLPAGDRAVYVREGAVNAVTETGSSFHWKGSALTTEADVTLVADEQDTVLWRWELAGAAAAREEDFVFRSAPETTSTLKLAAECELDERYGWLMRCDTVTFPPGGVAFTHVHQGPGIRITLEGEITIDTEGTRRVYGPGEAWAEKGVLPVYAPTTDDSGTVFVRCFLLPRQVKGASSLRIVAPEDRVKPNTQKYRVLAERIMGPVRAAKL
jgi:hypothetical protein